MKSKLCFVASFFILLLINSCDRKDFFRELSYGMPQIPILQPSPGEYFYELEVWPKDLPNKSIFYWTTDLDAKIEERSKWEDKPSDKPLYISSGIIFKYFIETESGYFSDVNTVEYVLIAPPPLSNPVPGTYPIISIVSIKLEKNCTIYYTLDGSSPLLTPLPPITYPNHLEFLVPPVSTKTLTFYIKKMGFKDSAVFTWVYSSL